MIIRSIHVSHDVISNRLVVHLKIRFQGYLLVEKIVQKNYVLLVISKKEEKFKLFYHFGS